ncbi:hypothetical protein ABQ179_021695 [Xanthomonas dyei]|uniref:hypothetical protein n=1 Tax=Xanthomonas dyei TaxID=743699 RepID=UPI0032E90792
MRAKVRKRPSTKAIKAARKSASDAPIALTPGQEALLATIIQEGMTRMRWSRAYAERKARRFLSRADTPEKLASIAAKLGTLDSTPIKASLKPFEKKVPGKKKLPKNEPKPKPPLTPGGSAGIRVKDLC